jgi:hypothetical protein
MWDSQFDLLFMAQEHNRDLVRQAEAERLGRHLNGSLAERFHVWWTAKARIIRTWQRFPEKTAERATRKVEFREQY